MSITVKQIANKGGKRVRHDEGAEFMLSVVQDGSGVVGIFPYAIGAKQPRHGKHYLIPVFARDDYFSHLEFVEGRAQ